MPAKRKVVAKKAGKPTSFKKTEKPMFKKGQRNGSKIGKKDAEEKPMSNTKLKKKEFQAKRYNKKPKKAAEEEEDSDFEVVRNPAAKPSTFAGNDALDHNYTSGDDDSDDGDDGAVDMFGGMRSNAPTQEVDESNDVQEDIDQASDDSDDESKFIAAENLNANRKKKKSGGFQSMG